MRYTSTRDHAVQASFEEAITQGYAPGGGLFVPQSLPQIDAAILQQWSLLSYPQLTFAILRRFISETEIPSTDLRQICEAALTGFDDCDHIVPIREVGGLFVAELFHGPTFCFKDLGMRALIGFLSYFALRRKRPMTLVAATTGDTGPAAVQAVSDLNNPLLTCLIHFPKDQISEFQRRQMTCVNSPCVKIATFEGGGDDMDRPIKNLILQSSTHTNNNNNHVITGVNSYNIGRPLMQMVHFVWSYLRVAERLQIEPGDPDHPMDVVLPTGAMGNMVGGYLAKQMGIPFRQFVSGVNVNDITHRVMTTGKFYKSAEMHMTLSEAINIQLPYNFERLLYYLIECNDQAIQQWMATVDATQQNDLPPQWLKLLQQEFQSARVTDEELCRTMRHILEKHNYLMDPHTTVAFAAAQELGYYHPESDETAPNNNPPVILLSTASPCKFQEAVTTAVGKEEWQHYFETDFPAQGKALLEQPEIAPVLYKAKETLEQSQQAWEQQARAIIAGLVVDEN